MAYNMLGAKETRLIINWIPKTKFIEIWISIYKFIPIRYMWNVLCEYLT